MPNIISKKIWKRWYPEELDSYNVVKKTAYIVHEDKLLKKNKKDLAPTDIKKELYTRMKSEKNEREYQKKITQGEEEGYKIGIKRGLLEFKKQKQDVQKKINTFLSDFELALDSLDSVISTRLVHLALKITAKIIGETPLIKTSYVLNRIKEIMQSQSINFYKPKLIIHPDDNELIKKNFGKIFSMYGWSILCDNRINLGGCKIESEDSNLDTTISTLWRELCRLSLFNENS